MPLTPSAAVTPSAPLTPSAAAAPTAEGRATAPGPGATGRRPGAGPLKPDRARPARGGGPDTAPAGSAGHPAAAGRSAATRQQPRHGQGWHALSKRRWQLSGFLAVIMLIAAVAGVALAVSRHTAGRHGTSRHGGSEAGSQTLSAAAAIRAQAVTWVLQQVGSSAIVSCDPLVCMALAARGFPAGSLLQLGPTTPNPVGSAVVIATPAVRSQYGSQLESDYAPDVLASFGSGSSRIDVRVVASRGTAPYQALLAADVAARKAACAALLHNRNVTASATAASQLSAWRGRLAAARHAGPAGPDPAH